jgi:hypothetical protein
VHGLIPNNSLFKYLFYFIFLKDVVPIGFLSFNISVSVLEDSDFFLLEFGVMEGHYLDVEVYINFTTIPLTAEGNYDVILSLNIAKQHVCVPEASMKCDYPVCLIRCRSRIAAPPK